MWKANQYRRGTKRWWLSNSAFLRAGKPMEPYSECFDHESNRWLEMLEKKNCWGSSVRFHWRSQSKITKFRNNHKKHSSYLHEFFLGDITHQNVEFVIRNGQLLPRIIRWRGLKKIKLIEKCNVMNVKREMYTYFIMTIRRRTLKKIN